VYFFISTAFEHLLSKEPNLMIQIELHLDLKQKFRFCSMAEAGILF